MSSSTINPSRKKRLSRPLGCLIAMMVFWEASGTIAADIAPVDTWPMSASYGEWAARWWRWVLETPLGPEGDHPARNANCSVGQHGDVWFIGAQFEGIGGWGVSRYCTIPQGKSLFLPIATTASFAYLKDALRKSTGAALRQQVSCEGDPTLATLAPASINFGDFKLEVTIDGKTVDNPQQYYVLSPLFTVELPTKNILGLTEKKVKGLLLTPGITSGYFLFLPPLTPGEHHIHWSSVRACHNVVNEQNINYYLTIE